MNIGLLVVGIVVSLLILIASIYFVAYFQHSEDKLTAWGPKIVVVAGISLAVYNVLLLPLAISNKTTGGLPLHLISITLLDCTLVFCIFLIPFMILYYEGIEELNDDHASALAQRRNNALGKACFSFKQFGYACKWMIPVLLVVGGVFVPLYFAFGYSKQPMVKLTSNFISGSFSAFSYFCDDSRGASLSCSKAFAFYKIRVNPFTYGVAIVDIVGWLLLSVFGGIGAVALPIESARRFRMKLLLLKRGEYQRKKRALSIQIAAALEEYQRICREKASKSLTKVQIKLLEKRFEKQVLSLEQEHQSLEQRNRETRIGNSGLNKFVELSIAIGSLSVYALWTVQLVAYTIPKMLNRDALFTFMNVLFIKLSKIPLAGTLIYGTLAVWWIAFTLKGEWKVSEQLSFLSIYPIQMGETAMNSLLVNTGIILACSVSILHMSLLSFQEYSSFTYLSSLFCNQIQNIFPFQLVFQVMICALVLMSPITAVVYLVSAVFASKKAKQTALNNNQTAKDIVKGEAIKA